jgi:hypothetical protein
MEAKSVSDFSVMRVLTQGGVEDVEVDAPNERSLLGSYWNAVQNFLNTGDESHLEDFEGERVAGRILETDPDRIEYWARYGELDFEDIYESTR